jgi:para-nitrobenzyl esterase
MDGRFLTHWPNEAVASGATVDVDLIVGSNRDEAKIFLFADPRRGKLEESDLVRRVTAQFGGDPAIAGDVIETIRTARTQRGEPADPWEIYCTIFTDHMIRVPSLRFLEAHTARGGAGRSYLFEWESPIAGLGACHGLEIPFCLGTLGSAEGIADFAGSGPEAEHLEETMRGLWMAFARGDADALAAWPAYDGKRRATMVFAAQTHAADAPCEAERAVLAAADSEAGAAGVG